LALNESLSFAFFQITWKNSSFAFFKLQEGFSISFVEQMEFRKAKIFGRVLLFGQYKTMGDMQLKESLVGKWIYT
jgi:hypothetical protein